jgi:uroporphyrinogen-III decarboxylase
MAAMTAVERIEAAIRLEKPDRVPLVPIIDMFSSRYGGITQHDMMFDVDKADLALQRTLDDLGGIDGFHFSYAGLGRTFLTIVPSPLRMPGIDGVPVDEEFQFVEKSVMEPEEYAQIEERGSGKWFIDKLRANHPELSSPVGIMKIFAGLTVDVLKNKRSIRRWRRKGVEPLVGPNVTIIPIEATSMALRSFNDFILDLFRHPEEVKAGCRAMMKTFENLGMMMVLQSGIKRVFMGGTRTSASFISPRQFEEFALWQWMEMSEYFVAKGVTPILHLDSDWTDFFPYLKNLPKRKCVLNLDGTSDIFKAKEVLGDHMCIMGDVPAALLKLGEPEEVDEYCRKLITEVGADGGFVLSSGCTIPIDARPENVKAMLASVKSYRP